MKHVVIQIIMCLVLCVSAWAQISGGGGGSGNAGTVTSVTGTAPISSSGGATPAISISATPTFGTAGTTTGSVAITSSTASAGTTTISSAASSYTNNTFTLPTVATTGPTSEPGTSGMALTSTTAGAQSYVAEQGSFCMDGELGELLTTARQVVKMANAGHFTNLAATATLTGTCSTQVEFNVYDITASTSGSATTGLTTTVATVVNTAQTLTFSAGDQVAIGVSTAGSTCTAPLWSVCATYTQP